MVADIADLVTDVNSFLAYKVVPIVVAKNALGMVFFHLQPQLQLLRLMVFEQLEFECDIYSQKLVQEPPLP